MIKLFLFKLLLSTCFLLTAQTNTNRIQRISVPQGLSDRSVIDIIQDQTGFLWIATPNVLNRYDGYHFTYFNNNSRNPKQINGNGLKEIRDAGNSQIAIVYHNDYDFIDLLQTNSAKTLNLFLHPEYGIHGKVKDVYIEENNGIHILSVNRDSLLFSKYKEGLNFETKLKLNEEVFNDTLNYRFIVAKDGFYWLHLGGTGLMKIDSNKIIQRFSSQDFENVKRAYPQALSIMHEDRHKRLWIALSGSPGIYSYMPDSKQFELFPGLPDKEYYTHLWEDDLGNLIFSIPNRDEARVVEKLFGLNVDGDILDFSFLSNEENKINVIFAKDFFSTLFMGTYVGIVKVLQKDGVKNILSQDLAEGKWGNVIRGIEEDNNGNIFIAKENRRWYQLDSQNGDLKEITDPETGQIVKFGTSLNLKFDPAGLIWGASSDSSEYYLNRLDLKTKALKLFNAPGLIRDFLLGKDGKLWLVCSEENSGGRLIIFDPETEKFSPYHSKSSINPLEDASPFYILESKNGLLWIGSNNGLLCIDRNKKTSTWLKVEPENPENSLSNNTILVIHETLEGLLYLGTAGGGLNILDPETGSIKIFDQQNGLANNQVFGILPDEKNNFWISTSNGLSYFDTQNESFRNFYTGDGLSHNEFNRFSFFKDSKGQYYFGGMNGLNVFRSEDLLKSDADFPLCLTSFSKYNSKKQMLIVEDTSLQNIRKVYISPYDTYFQFDFAILDLRQPEKNQYKYWLEGFDEDWSYLGQTPFIRFNKLPAGDYTLHIKAAGSNGHWKEEPLNIDIQVGELFYNTLWAYMVYSLILLAGIYFLYRFQLDRKLGLAETRKLKELDQAKSLFYANITHEFRTPLTLISGPANRAISNIDKLSKEELLKDLQLISRNSQHLLQLVNQMLDLNKLDAGNLQPDFVKGDVMAYLKYISDSFYSLAESKNIQLTFYAENDHLLMDYDKQKLFQILSNLLFNAIKFTPEGGQVIVHTGGRDDQLYINVKDNGVGIDPKHLSYIFNRFYQGENETTQIKGTGIGLALCKELVHLLEGTIRVESEINKGTTFHILLPVHQNAVLEEKTEAIPVEAHSLANAYIEEEESLPKIKENGEGTDDGSRILIIEDNKDVAQYIADCLHKNYSLAFAENGRIGIEKALELVPDIIISDVMMPEKDGFEVCEVLKNDQRSSHIPIILLTALADVSSKIKGLKRGADDYLAKPFDEKELLVRIENLLELRKTLQKKYSQSIFEEQPEIKVIDQTEDLFLMNVKTIIEKYLNDSQFNITRLCKEIGMSRTQLHRKFTALTGESATKFIRSVRLAKAKTLLSKPGLTIAEVAYDTGFSDPNYFSRLFSQAYGCSPSEYQQKHR